MALRASISRQTYVSAIHSDTCSSSRGTPGASVTQSMISLTLSTAGSADRDTTNPSTFRAPNGTSTREPGSTRASSRSGMR